MTQGDEPLPITDRRAEHAPMTKAEWASALRVAAGDVLPKALIEQSKARRGRPASQHPKRLVAIRLDSDLVDAMRETGKGWQTKANSVLRREWFEQ